MNTSYKKYNIKGIEFNIDTRYTLSDNILGKGSYGMVVEGKDNKTGEVVAIKKILNVFSSNGDAKRILREIKLLRKLKHPNIISAKNILISEDKKSFKQLYIVNEKMDTDLENILDSEQELSLEHRQYFLFQILTGLKYLHTR
jgi:serine/threonine protein kinase